MKANGNAAAASARRNIFMERIMVVCPVFGFVAAPTGGTQLQSVRLNYAHGGRKKQEI